MPWASGRSATRRAGKLWSRPRSLVAAVARRGWLSYFPRMCRILLLSLALAACGSSTSPQGSVGHAGTTTAGTTDGAGPGSDVECHDETSTGSSIPHQVCRSKFQADQDKKGAQDFMNSPRPAAGVAGPH